MLEHQALLGHLAGTGIMCQVTEQVLMQTPVPSTCAPQGLLILKHRYNNTEATHQDPALLHPLHQGFLPERLLSLGCKQVLELKPKRRAHQQH